MKPETRAPQAQQPEQQLGWGSNIRNARLARAAQLALQQGDHGLALTYAQRAAESAPNDPQLWFLLGYAARLDGRYGQSANAYKRGLHLDSTSLDGMSGLAQTLSLMGRIDEAVHLLKQVIASDPRRRDDSLLLGDLSMRSGDYTSAIEWLEKAERMRPDARSELLMAVAYGHLNRRDEAVRYLALAKSRAPNNPDVMRSLAGYYRESGEYGKAIDELKAIANPKPDVVAELAYTYELDGKLKESAQLYTQAANALPRNLNLQLSAAQAAIAVNTIGPANSFLDRAAKIDPDHYRLHVLRGEIAQMQDHDEKAVQEYNAAVAHLPAAPVEGPLYGIQLHMHLNELYQNLDEAEPARQQLEEAQTKIAAVDEHGVDQAAFLRLRGLIRMNAGQIENALNDVQQSLALSPRNIDSLQLEGDLLMKLGRIEDEIAAYKKVLAIDPRNRFALSALGYASRAAGNDHDAEKYFHLLAQDDPSFYVPYLALGDLYTARGRYKEAQASYARGYKAAPNNALIVAGGMNAAIEAHDLPLAGMWLDRVTQKMEMTPQVLREKERYFSFKGDALKSAELGRKAIVLLPRDRDVVVYLGYDLLSLGQYKELLALTQKYEDVFPQEPDIPLLAGYVYTHDGRPEEALEKFTEALNRGPNVVTAYVSRGYVLNDLQRSEQAAADFEQALKREPKNGKAHLGLAFAELQLNHSRSALRHAELAEAVLGDSKPIHIIRATAYGREGRLRKAAAEYRAALKFTPDDGSLYLSLANLSFAERRYQETVRQLQAAQTHLPDDPRVYALMARAHANLDDREQTLRDVRIAEEYAGRRPGGAKDTNPIESDISDIYVSTGEALSTLGDQNAAMERFGKALVAPHSNRVSVRLAIALLMAQQGHSADAERQIALAQMEADAGDTAPVTGDQYSKAAQIFQQMHEYQLSQSYLQRARAAGAPDSAVRVAMANNYLALGDTPRAAAELAAVKRADDGESEYEYLLAQAGLYQQEHHPAQALSSFAAAASAAGEDQRAGRAMLQAGANEGLRVTPQLSLLSDLSVQPIFEDSTVYVLDAKLDSPNGPVPITDPALLPPPRSSLETNWTLGYHLHLGTLPTAGGFAQIRNARGSISVPATDSIVNRNTTDYTINFGLNPTIHIGSNALTFNSGVQGTIRRDSLAPIEMNQNLFRAFVYATTSSFFNAISADGYFIHEAGPFTESPISERALAGAINFRVGAPWGKTALVTGWGLNDQQFTSAERGNSENDYTSSYIGLTRQLTPLLGVKAIAEYVRAWRVVPYSPLHSGIAQALRPAAAVDFSPASNWDIQASASYESTRSVHVYDMIQSGFALSYTRPFGRTFNEETGEVHLKYPIRLSAGVQQETFPNFTHGQNQQFRPYVSISLF